MTIDFQEEYSRLVQTFENPNFSREERAAIADQLDENTGMSTIAALLWQRLPIDLAFSSQPAMMMVKPPGDNFSTKAQEHVQWTWRDHHFMLFALPLREAGQSMIGLLVADDDPVMEVYAEHEPDDRTILKNHQLYAMRPGPWIDDFMSYWGAFCRMRTVSEATREKYRPEMEEFWRKTGI